MTSEITSFNAQLDGLSEKGRGIYFYHDGNSNLPVRDISGKNKKEPYIEYGWENDLNEEYVVGAENYCNRCYPEAVKRLAESDEQYLFLTSTPQHLDMKRSIVGYIRKEEYEEFPENDRVAVIGETKIYRFEDSIPVNEFGKSTSGGLGKYGDKFDEEDTREILEHFSNCDDVTEEVLTDVLERK